MWEVLLDALIDSAKILPILFLTYLLVEYILHRKKENSMEFVSRNRRKGPLFGALLGIFPQCGFSAAIADFYSKKYVSIGTLFAVFIATSDEAIIILLSHPDRYIELIVLIAIKFVLAVIVGYSVDLIFNKQKFEKPHLECLSGEKEHCHNHHNHCEHCNSKDEKEHYKCCCSDNIFVSAIKQTIEIFVFLLIANVVLSLIIYFIGEQNVQQILVKDSILLPFVTPLIGLIPNCFASVFLVQMYLQSIIPFSAMLGGLVSGAGLGLLVLYKKNKNIKQNILITLSILGLGVLVGLVGFAIGF